MTAAHAFAGGSPAVRPGPRTFEVMGIPVSAIDMDAAVATIEGWVDTGARHYVCVAGAHGLVESRTNLPLRRSLRAAGLVTPDGMPLVWVARLRGIAKVSRVYGPDLMTALSGSSSPATCSRGSAGSTTAAARALPSGCATGCGRPIPISTSSAASRPRSGP